MIMKYLQLTTDSRITLSIGRRTKLDFLESYFDYFDETHPQRQPGEKIKARKKYELFMDNLDLLRGDSGVMD